MDTARAAAIFKALGDENRVRIMQLLQEGEKCACKLLEEFDFSQFLFMSMHTVALRECG